MQQLRVRGDMAKRRAQVVGHRVGKRFQFLVACLELRSPLLKLPVELLQLARCLGALVSHLMPSAVCHFEWRGGLRQELSCPGHMTLDVGPV